MEPTTTPTPTSTPPPTVTAIPTVTLDLEQIIPTTGQLAGAELAAWNIGAPTAPLFVGLAGVLLIFGLVTIIKAMVTWRAHAD